MILFRVTPAPHSRPHYGLGPGLDQSSFAAVESSGFISIRPGDRDRPAPSRLATGYDDICTVGE